MKCFCLLELSRRRWHRSGRREAGQASGAAGEQVEPARGRAPSRDLGEARVPGGAIGSGIERMDERPRVNPGPAALRAYPSTVNSG